MKNFLLLPPITFILIFYTSLIIFKILSRLALRPKKHSAGEKESYACGEDTYDHKVQPDYSGFFPFAFFFTLAHVATLMIATVPMATVKTFSMAIIYMIAAVIGLYILLRS